MTRFWERRYAGAVVAAIAMVLHAPTVFFGKVGLDDDWLWSDTSPMRHLDLHQLHQVFFDLQFRVRETLGGEYLPVRDVLVGVDMAIWGHNNHGPHITQLLLFGLIVWALGTMLLRWRFSPPVAWTGVLLWAAHPLCVQSVSWISERKGILAAVFVIATGHAWARWREHGKLGALVLAILAAVCGVWSNAPAMFAPVVFAAWDLLLLPRGSRRWIAFVAVGGAAMLAAVAVVLVASRAHTVAGLQKPPKSERSRPGRPGVSQYGRALVFRDQVELSSTRPGRFASGRPVVFFSRRMPKPPDGGAVPGRPASA